jgi:hypothetical protein
MEHQGLLRDREPGPSLMLMAVAARGCSAALFASAAVAGASLAVEASRDHNSQPAQ